MTARSDDEAWARALYKALDERDEARDERDRLRLALCEARDHLPHSPGIADRIVRFALRPIPSSGSSESSGDLNSSTPARAPEEAGTCTRNRIHDGPCGPRCRPMVSNGEDKT